MNALFHRASESIYWFTSKFDALRTIVAVFLASIPVTLTVVVCESVIDSTKSALPSLSAVNCSNDATGLHPNVCIKHYVTFAICSTSVLSISRITSILCLAK